MRQISEDKYNITNENHGSGISSSFHPQISDEKLRRNTIMISPLNFNQ